MIKMSEPDYDTTGFFINPSDFGMNKIVPACKRTIELNTGKGQDKREECITLNFVADFNELCRYFNPRAQTKQK